jgi:hypothetical protein
MDHGVYVAAHIVAACGALVSGVGALVFPNGSKMHRRFGKGYLVGWAGLSGSGMAFNFTHAGMGAFAILAVVGALFVAAAFALVKLKTRASKSWRRAHYLCMAASLAALLGPTSNQVLWHLGLEYPKPVFWVVICAPWLALLVYARRLDATYAVSRR